MSADANDIFRAWTDLTLAGVRAYSSAVLTGLELATRATPAVPAFPSPAIQRASPQREMWPAAGSFGGGSNAVAAWTDVASTMMGMPPARGATWPGMALNPFSWMMPAPAQVPILPWFTGMMTPAAFGPMAMWGRSFGMPGIFPGLGWPMPAMATPFAPPSNFADPFGMFGMMAPMFQAFAPRPQRTSRYH